MQSLWLKLNSHRHMPNCTCPRASRRGALHVVRNYRNEDQVIQFSIELNDQLIVVMHDLGVAYELSSFYQQGIFT
jgi:hypothetical protein